MKALESLRRLVLADNPLLGKLTQQQRLGGAPDTASKYVGPEQLFWLETRLFRGAPLQLLDLRHTGTRCFAFWAAAWRHSALTGLLDCCKQASAMLP